MSSFQQMVGVLGRAAPQALAIEYVLVGGGGVGGVSTGAEPGGGGGGGDVSAVLSRVCQPGESLAAVIGLGGSVAATNGGTTTFAGNSATGGGYGGAGDGSDPL